MVFSSITFIFIFLPLVVIFYYITPKKLKNVVLFLSSLFFYAWGEPIYILLMIFSIIFNYIIGIDIELNKHNHRSKKNSLIFGIIVNLFILGFFKYYGFLVENLNFILPFKIKYSEISLPIGISFYTFQTLSYIIDVYYERVPVQKNIIYFGTYVSMFPQLIAGPIIKYSDVNEQLNNRKESFYKFSLGIIFFIRGLGKKVIIANNMGIIFNNILSNELSQISILSAWLSCLAYTLQIYFDFSGYSDMAIGLGKMFGFEFKKNFDYPYISRSITEFWHRWHISLSTWFKEYVYIPLGGNRVSKLMNIRNLLIVWFLTGLWHGASWNFIVWGLYYGIILIIEKFIFKIKERNTIPVISNIFTIIIIMIGWVFFFSPNLTYALDFIKIMFGFAGNVIIDNMAIYTIISNGILFIISILGSTSLVFNFLMKRSKANDFSFPIIATCFYLITFILSIAFLLSETYNPFMYFRF